MSLTADEIATMESTDLDFEHVANAMFNASIAQHLVSLDAAALEALATSGILLVDKARITARDFAYDTVYVLTDAQDITEQEKLTWNFPRFTPQFMFSGLKDFVMIQRHMLRLPRDHRAWHDLSHIERLRVAIGYVSVIAPPGRVYEADSTA